MGFQSSLNITRHSILRQYFGKEIKSDKDNRDSCESFAYGSGSGTGSVDMDPYNFVTHKITSDMRYMACEIHKILASNRSVF